MRVAVLTVFLMLFVSSACLAEEPQALEGGSLPEPEAIMDRSVLGLDEAPPTFDTDRHELAEYYNQRMDTVEGVITAIDLEARTIIIKDDAGEKEYFYDELTRFQVRLAPVGPEDIRVGSKMAGLHTMKDGAAYVGRVVIMAPSKKTRRRR